MSKDDRYMTMKQLHRANLEMMKSEFEMLFGILGECDADESDLYKLAFYEEEIKNARYYLNKRIEGIKEHLNDDFDAYEELRVI